jgi:hypothetical protein
MHMGRRPKHWSHDVGARRRRLDNHADPVHGVSLACALHPHVQGATGWLFHAAVSVHLGAEEGERLELWRRLLCWKDAKAALARHALPAELVIWREARRVGTLGGCSIRCKLLHG